MKILSSAFKNNEKIPERYTCDGDDVNPPLQFEDVPENADSLALIMADPDAPGRTFYHWILFNMDPAVDHIDEDSVPSSAELGKNDFGRLEYGGPCPPLGTHHYVFTLFALDTPLPLKEGATAQELEKAMEGDVLETAQLIGLYSKK